jgi:hypothetical protein
VDPGEQLLVVEGPADVVVTPARERSDPVDRISFRLTEEDHGDVSIPRAARLAFTEAATELRTGQVRQLVAEKRQVRPLLLGKREGLLARDRLDDRETVLD